MGRPGTECLGHYHEGWGTNFFPAHFVLFLWRPRVGDQPLTRGALPRPPAECLGRGLREWSPGHPWESPGPGAEPEGRGAGQSEVAAKVEMVGPCQALWGRGVPNSRPNPWRPEELGVWASGVGWALLWCRWWPGPEGHRMTPGGPCSSRALLTTSPPSPLLTSRPRKLGTRPPSQGSFLPPVPQVGPRGSRPGDATESLGSCTMTA